MSAASLISFNGYEGFWFSTNCTDQLPCICMTGENEFVLPEITTVTSSSIITLAATANIVIRNATELAGLLHGKYNAL